MTGKNRTALAASALLLAALALAGFWFLQRTVPETCRICQRPIHPQARAVMEVEGRQEPLCCVRCALTLRRQQRQPVRLVEVTDYLSRRPLPPADAYYVEGSRILLCEKHEPMLDETKHPYARVFDRCVPSLYAFATRADAQAFAEQQGGTVLRLPELLQEVEPRP